MALLAAAGPLAAQNHPELEWQVLETAHFRILFHGGLEQVAARAAGILERAYGPLTGLYGYEPPGPVRIILKDYDDYANGAAYFYHDAIEIWTSPLEHDFELRGTSDWLPNVLTHEFTHIISLGAARKGSPRVPAAFLEYFGYKQEKNRKDVLTGAPDRLVVYPLANTVVPMWLAEGVAQYMADGVQADRWDTHRDMVLRVAVLDSTLLSYDRMGVFAKAGFGNEFVYDHGYGFSQYIAREHGQQALAHICRNAGAWGALNTDRAIEQATGVPARQLWRNWRDWMAQRYQSQVAALGERREGEVLVDVGFANTRPAYSPDGARLAYLSTGKSDSGPQNLVVRDLASGEEEVVARAVASTVSWSPDGRRLLFVRKDEADRYGSRRADLYELDLDAPERGLGRKLAWVAPALVGVAAPRPYRERQLTQGLRSLYPAYSPDGRRAAFVRVTGSGCSLGLLDLEAARAAGPLEAGGSGLAQPEGAVRYLLSFGDGSQIYTPQWSADGQHLVFSYAVAGQRDIGRVAVDGEVSPAESGAAVAGASPARGIEVLLASPGTDRDPAFVDGGRGLVFVSDASGIYNVYRMDLVSGQVAQVTNLVGGAFDPTASPSGQVAFAAYAAQGYEIRVIGGEGAVNAESRRFRPDGAAASSVPQAAAPARVSAPGPTSAAFAPAGAPAPPSEPSPGTPAAQPYGLEFLRTSLMPRLAIDEGYAKAGLYFGSEDAVTRQSVYGGASVAPTNGDRDLYSVYTYRGWVPTVKLSFIHLKRHSDRGDSSEARDYYVTGMNFSLNRISAGLTQALSRTTELDVAATYDRYDASLETDVFVPRTDGQPGFERLSQKPYGYTYLNGFGLDFTYRHDSVPRRRDRDINPRGGRRLYFRYDRMFNYFIKGFDEYNTSFIDEQYLKLFYNQVTLDWNEYVPLPAHAALALRFYGGWVGSDRVDDERVGNFFDFHLGGITFMKGYTYYSIEGRKAAMGSATVRVPVFPDMGRSLLNLYFDKVYAAAYADVGKAWDGKVGDPDPSFGRQAPLRDVG
ncbi:MAG: BamA/TamA family outer membrane protein, partial [Gemmatimonadota bacterium]